MGARDTWSLRPGQTLQYRHWDGEYVLYNDLSGDTHLLGELAVALLLALRAGPATRQALAGTLKAEFDVDAADLADFDAETNDLLLHMKRLYLVDSPAC